MEETFAIIKPDGYPRREEIVSLLQDLGFSVLGRRDASMERAGTEEFYAEHKGKAFYDDLIQFMTSGPVLLLHLEAADGIARLRKIIGCSDPAKAEQGTIRQKFGSGGMINAIHASDSPASAKRELQMFFPTLPVPRKDLPSLEASVRLAV